MGDFPDGHLGAIAGCYDGVVASPPKNQTLVARNDRLPSWQHVNFEISNEAQFERIVPWKDREAEFPAGTPAG
jgi:hypothetical protein